MITKTRLDGIIYSFANIYKADKKYIYDHILNKNFFPGSSAYNLYKSIADGLQDSETTYICWVRQTENSAANLYQGGDQWAYLGHSYNSIDPNLGQWT